ncbi:MAG: hypothetical protein R2685_12050 [Candidatus Nitrosocosmicus sp.]|nr:hypothetical protein [Candidatus Nitrosocosmicus sp.]
MLENFPIYRTSINYSWGTDLDLSNKDNYSLRMPSTEIMFYYGLKFNKHHELVDNNNIITSFNASLSTGGRKVLFFSKGKMIKYLEEMNQTLYWTVNIERIRGEDEKSNYKLVELGKRGLRIIDVD